jgi:hypothetical protein
MRRSGAGLTLIASTQRSVLEIQMVRLVIDGPPAPPMGAPSIFLVEPDGTSIEFPAPSSPTQKREGLVRLRGLITPSELGTAAHTRPFRDIP